MLPGPQLHSTPLLRFDSFAHVAYPVASQTTFSGSAGGWHGVRPPIPPAINATMNKGHFDPGQSILVSLIAEYVGRQELVLDVMRDYRPDWLAKDRAERRRH